MIVPILYFFLYPRPDPLYPIPCVHPSRTSWIVSLTKEFTLSVSIR
jgi:hypothetical protein